MTKKTFFSAHEMRRTCNNAGSNYCTDCPKVGRRQEVVALFQNGHEVRCIKDHVVTYHDKQTPKRRARI